MERGRIRLTTFRVTPTSCLTTPLEPPIKNGIVKGRSPLTGVWGRAPQTLRVNHYATHTKNKRQKLTAQTSGVKRESKTHSHEK
jgi:hypothetical protein